jgi:hypothetical protein
MPFSYSSNGAGYLKKLQTLNEYFKREKALHLSGEEPVKVYADGVSCHTLNLFRSFDDCCWRI